MPFPNYFPTSPLPPFVLKGHSEVHHPHIILLESDHACKRVLPQRKPSESGEFLVNGSRSHLVPTETASNAFSARSRHRALLHRDERCISLPNAHLNPDQPAVCHGVTRHLRKPTRKGGNPRFMILSRRDSSVSSAFPSETPRCFRRSAVSLAVLQIAELNVVMIKCAICFISYIF